MHLKPSDYLAENIQDGCRVALKVLHSRFADDPSTMDTCLMKDLETVRAPWKRFTRHYSASPSARRAPLAGAAREEPRVIVRWIAPVLLGLAALLMFTLHHVFGSTL